MAHLMTLDSAQVDTLTRYLAYSPADVTAAQAAFVERYPAYAETATLDSLRAREYARLDALNQVYLDYTGGGLYAESQLERHNDVLRAGVYGNPHSVNPTSLASTQLVDEARAFVYRYFNADPDEYVIIFTSNASGALKIVGESYPFEDNGQYLLTFDNHNSVNGIREYAHHYNAPVHYAPITLPELRFNEDALHELLDSAIADGNNLFAFPAQSNFSGVQHDLGWIQTAQAKGWDVLVDCAAFTPTNHLDLSQWKPDFVPLSFYKMFGYPTGIGALIARRSTLAKLRRPWFAGGTVEVASAITPAFFRAADEAAFEDGTINYLHIPAVEIGLQHLQETGIDCIHKRVVALTGYLLDEMTSLRHDNGSPLITLYGPDNTDRRGGTIAFNIIDPDAAMFDVRLVESMANHANISLRTGCFCNPGAGENAFHLTPADIQQCSVAAAPVTYERYIAALTTHTGEVVTGAIRVSVGVVSNFADVYHFVQFLKSFLNQKSSGFMASA